MLLSLFLKRLAVLRHLAAVFRHLARRHFRRVSSAATGQVDVDPPFVFLGLELEPFFAAQLLYSWLDLLDMIWRMVALADYYMEMRLVLRFGRLDAFLQDSLCFLHKLPVKVDGIGRNSVYSVVLAEDEFRSLFVVAFAVGLVLLALLRKVMRFAAVVRLICLMGLFETTRVMGASSIKGVLEYNGPYRNTISSSQIPYARDLEADHTHPLNPLMKGG